MRSGTPGVTIDVFQNKHCRIKHLDISLDFFSTLAKVVTRFRMVVVSWPLGWVALILVTRLGSRENSGQSQMGSLG